MLIEAMICQQVADWWKQKYNKYRNCDYSAGADESSGMCVIDRLHDMVLTGRQTERTIRFLLRKWQTGTLMQTNREREGQV